MWKGLGKEVSMEMGEGWKGGEQGDEDGDEDVGQVPQIERFIKNCPLPPALFAHR